MIYAGIDRDPIWLSHHGILGQKHGVRNGPPYPLNRQSSQSVNFPSPKAIELLKQDKEASKFLDYDLKNSFGSVLIDNKTGKLQGYVFVGNKKDKGFIYDLTVQPEYRGQGLGKKLLDDAVKKHGGYDLIVDKDNTIAFNMYKKYGFKTYQNPDSQDQYYMTLGEYNID